MNLLIDASKLEGIGSRENVPIRCENCQGVFYRPKNLVCVVMKGKAKNRLRFCSEKCQHKNKIKTVEYKCKRCEKPFNKPPCEAKKSINHFCSQSCAATYNNTHKTKGYRRSKLEIWLEMELIKNYPNLEIHFNKKDAINSELDIYIPSLKLAFELNGIFHYEPIYGKEKLTQIQNNDDRKFQACLERSIELCTIDVSGLKYFKDDRAKKYLDILIKIIGQKISV